MENLTEKVYECTLAVEAHMICDLLTRAGIAARVDGAFLSGVGGELPLGNTVKVRVAPESVTEAREVIAEWEKLQTGDVIPPTTASSRFRSPLWFLAGVLAGGTLVFVAFSQLAGSGDGVDYDGDGDYEVSYHYAGALISRTDIDRNDDGQTDARWHFDMRGLESRYEADDDFDGRFEWQSEVKNGELTIGVLDSNGDGRPEQVTRAEHGVLRSIDYYFASGGRIVKREFYGAGLLDSAEYDDDGDGTFERRVRFDQHGEVKL